MSTPESGTPTPTQKAVDQRPKLKERDVVAGLHRAADELAKELHKAADTWEPSLVEGILETIEGVLEDIRQYPSAEKKGGNLA
ncbi:hypothetical protein IMSHALPRED_005111 [Imshaugia aleurites]|uniref:Uncharacterized protein n=1 Tax=Imshaugia aleurites TaxID=172621 RepID=A0A8H3FAR9_9LECA|nr:hypothetical protein IMSHALPRED_005111 [Imshaugia aleurites]